MSLWLKDFGRACVHFWNTQRLKAILMLVLMPPIYVGVRWVSSLGFDWVEMTFHPLIYAVFLMALLIVAVAVGLVAVNALVKTQRARAKEAGLLE